MTNLSLLDKQPINIHYIPEGADIEYYPNYFSELESSILYKYLLNNIKWRQDKIRIFGKEINLPRLTAWYGDSDKIYTYSGIKMNPMPWTKELNKIKEKIEQKSDVIFNSVLLNLYRNGNDHHSWHADDEPELGKNITIGSVNFGESRDFQLKHKIKKDLEKINIHLEQGSFLLMKHPTQLNWLHSVPKRKKVFNQRINLTFRYIAN